MINSIKKMIINELINNNNQLIILNKFMWNVIEYMLIRWI